MKHLSIILFATIIFASCGTTRKTQKAVPPAETQQEEVKPGDTMESMSSVLANLNTLDYKTFSGKIDVSYKDSKSKNYNFDVKLNMKKDELVWLSATGPLGIEVVRALITSDSVKILNKLEKTYTTSSISYLQDQIGLPVDLATMQDLLIGNPVFIDKESSSYVTEGNNLMVSSQTRYFRNLLTVMMPGYLPWISKLEDVDAARNRSAELTYADYKAQGDKQFSQTRKIKVNYKSNIDIDLEYKSYNFNGSVSTPFSVPSGYKRVIK